MFNNTPFESILKVIPRGLFDTAVKDSDANRYDKKFKSYDHLIALIFGQLSGAKSLRELETSFNSNSSSHYHLGTQAIKRSTLADANKRRDPAAFKAVAEQLMKQISKSQRRNLQPMLSLLDSTPIQLKSRGHQWAKANATNHQTGLKIHAVINGIAHTPSYINITNPNVNDVSDALNMPIEKDTIYVFDKGYCSYTLWHRIECAQSHFVTRFKRTAAVDVIENKAVTKKEIISDEIVTFRYKSNRAKHTNPYYGNKLRRVTVKRDGKQPIVLVTNLLNASASEIAALYKKRWDIELFFKWIKQNLKIKRFLGESKNAVILQIYAAIITYLLVWIYKKSQGVKTTLHLLLIQLKSTLFQRDSGIYQRKRRRHRQAKALIMEEKQHAMRF